MAGVLLKTVFLVVVAFCGTEVSSQTHHVVGGDDGWSSASNISSWLSGRVFRVGDKIWFTHPAAAESIVELQSLEELIMCDLANPIRMYTGVNHVTLEKEGTRYFTSGNLENCQNGMKLPVPVQPHPASGPASPTPPQPLPVSPPSSVPTPPQPAPIQPPPTTPPQPLPVTPPPSSVPTPPTPAPIQPPPTTPPQPLPVTPPPSSVPTPPQPAPIQPPPTTPPQPLPVTPPPSSVPTPPKPVPIQPPPTTPPQPLPVRPPPSVPTPPKPVPIQPPPPTPPSASTSLNMLSIVFFSGLLLSYFGL